MHHVWYVLWGHLCEVANVVIAEYVHFLDIVF